MKQEPILNNTSEQNHAESVRTVFLIGAKSLGAYGGYETFIDKLTEYHQNNYSVKYYVAVKANGQGAHVPEEAKRTSQTSYTYHNAECFEISIPEKMGATQAIYYDCASLRRTIEIIKKQNIIHPIVYIMTSRIGPFFNHYAKKIRKLGGKIYLNPDGHEWKRAKWSKPVKSYWKYSEKKMVCGSDLVVCDSKAIEKYIQETYHIQNTAFIAYGAETERSTCDETQYEEWLQTKGLKRNQYYLVVGRFVPENNYESMIREYMKTSIDKDFAIITNTDEKFLNQLKNRIDFSSDQRIKFVGTVYDKALLQKIREEAYGYLHGHEVGGTNPSLLEALASTKLNLLLDVDFNKEVAQEAALYWTKEDGSLSKLIEECETVDRDSLGERAKQRIREAYSWKHISELYEKIWENKGEF